MALTNTALTDLGRSVLSGTPTPRSQLLQLASFPNRPRRRRIRLSTHSPGPMALFAPFLHGKSRAYIRPSTPVGPHGGHVTCHWRCPKEWMKGVVATTPSGYCPLHLFNFLCFYNLLPRLVYCPCLFVPLLQACVHAPTSPTCLSAPYSLFSKCACQSCINNGLCPLVCSPVSLS